MHSVMLWTAIEWAFSICWWRLHDKTLTNNITDDTHCQKCRTWFMVTARQRHMTNATPMVFDPHQTLTVTDCSSQIIACCVKLQLLSTTLLQQPIWTTSTYLSNNQTALVPVFFLAMQHDLGQSPVGHLKKSPCCELICLPRSFHDHAN